MSVDSGKTEEGRCSTVAGLLCAYIDGEVTPAEKALVEGHLAHCEACAREMASLRLTVNLLQKLPVVEAPRSFTLAPAPRRQTGLFYLLRNATATLASVLLVLVAGSAYLQSAGPMAKMATPTASLAFKTGEPATQEAAEPRQFAAEALKAEAKPDTKPAAAPEAAKERALAQGAAATAPAAAASAGQEKALAPAAAPAAPPPPAVAAAPRAPAAADSLAPAPAAKPRAASGQPDASAEQPFIAGRGAAPAPAAVDSAAKPAAVPDRTPGGEVQQAAPERPGDKTAKVEAAPGQSTGDERQAAGPVGAAPATQGDPISSVVAALPLRELQLGVGALLVICAGVTAALWIKRRYP